MINIDAACKNYNHFYKKELKKIEKGIKKASKKGYKGLEIDSLSTPVKSMLEAKGFKVTNETSEYLPDEVRNYWIIQWI